MTCILDRPGMESNLKSRRRHPSQPLHQNQRQLPHLRLLLAKLPNRSLQVLRLRRVEQVDQWLLLQRLQRKRWRIVLLRQLLHQRCPVQLLTRLQNHRRLLRQRRSPILLGNRKVPILQPPQRLHHQRPHSPTNPRL